MVELSYEQAAQSLYKPVLDMWAAAGTEPASVGPTSESVTGVPARTYAHWAIDHVADFR
ncbi:hypothetical protein [Nocardia sp. NPDC051463]|uniref:hypothetical protein n=1 Tax=Nocardia sp. NPDC051463 TaxID=3154845 RepID=UPI00344E4D68